MPKFFTGRVVACNSFKTCTVRICHVVWHPHLKLYYKKYKNIMTHDAEGSVYPGDWVKIRHCQPISNRKRFAVEEIVKAFPRDDVEVNERNAKWREFLTKAKEARKRLAESKGSSISPPS